MMSPFARNTFALATLIAAGATARAATSTTPFTLSDPNAAVTIDASGTRTVSGASVTTNNFDTYNFAYNTGPGGITANGYKSLTIGTGGTVRMTLTPSQSTFGTIDLANPGTTIINGGTVERIGGVGPAILIENNSSKSTVFLRSGAINTAADVPYGAVAVFGTTSSLVMTGGSINAKGGDQSALVVLGAGGTYTYAGGVLTTEQMSRRVDVVGGAATATVNLFGSNFTYNGQPLANGTYVIVKDSPNLFIPGFNEITGKLLYGGTADFGLTGDPDSVTTLNVNVGPPPTVPEPASLALITLGGMALLRRQRRGTGARLRGRSTGR